MKLKLPDGPFGAYLFDCDGTIVDSMPLHYIAWKKVLAEWNCTFEERLFYSWGGTPTAEIVSLLNQRQGLNMPIEGVISRKENLYFELLPQLKAHTGSGGAYRGAARADSVCGGVRGHAGIGECVARVAEVAG